MKKILILTFALLCMAWASKAQTIHWLTFIDTKDSHVGQLDVTGRRILYSHFVNPVNTALAAKGYKSDIHDIYDYDLSPERCKSEVASLNVSSDDIIVFYYIGHGARPLDTSTNYILAHPFPQMLLGQTQDERCIPLEWVHNTLKNKGARLAITIGMCCNAFEPNMSKKDEPTFGNTYGPTYYGANDEKVIQKLFLGYKGSLIATSALPSQTSGGHHTAYGDMDFYTAELCTVMDNIGSSGVNSWDDLLKTVAVKVNNRTYGQQTPFHKSYLATAPIPNNSQSTPPPPPSGSSQDWKNQLNNALCALCNSNVNDETRILYAERILRVFGSNSIVKILAQDSDIVIDKEDADTFLGRLASTPTLKNVCVVDGTLDSQGRIITLSVREVYKR